MASREGALPTLRGDAVVWTHSSVYSSISGVVRGWASRGDAAAGSGSVLDSPPPTELSRCRRSALFRPAVF
jgi:hypothetical protein